MILFIKIAFVFNVTLLFSFCGKSVSLPPAKIEDSCELQYTVSKWLSIGDSWTLPSCPDSLTFILLGRDTSRTRFNTELKVVDLGANEDSIVGIDEHWYYRVLLFRLKIEKFTDTSILLRMWYNYSY